MNACETDLRPGYPAAPAQDAQRPPHTAPGQHAGQSPHTAAGRDAERHLRTALGQYATGVAVVTTVGPGGHPVGMTINSFGALSLDPPLILWCLRRTASRGAVFSAASHFAVNVLAAGQAPLARQFAARPQGEFGQAAWHPGPHGLPLLCGALGVFACRRAQQADGGDHVIVVGHIEEFGITAGRSPLVFHAGRYHALTPEEPGRERANSGSPTTLPAGRGSPRPAGAAGCGQRHTPTE